MVNTVSAVHRSAFVSLMVNARQNTLATGGSDGIRDEGMLDLALNNQRRSVPLQQL